MTGWRATRVPRGRARETAARAALALLGLAVWGGGLAGGATGCAATGVTPTGVSQGHGAGLQGAHAGAGAEAPPGGSAATAVGALRRYRAALVADDPDEAWALLAPGTLDRDTFRAFFHDHRQALILQAEELLRVARTTPPTEVAEVDSGARTYVLVRTPDGWRIRTVRGEGSPHPPRP